MGAVQDAAREGQRIAAAVIPKLARFYVFRARPPVVRDRFRE